MSVLNSSTSLSSNVQLTQNKVSKQLAQLGQVLEPFLDSIGSISPELVAQQISAGALSTQDFSGLFSKEHKSTLVVKLIPLSTPDRPSLTDH